MAALLLALSALFPNNGIRENALSASPAIMEIRTFRSTSVGGRLPTVETEEEICYSISEEPVRGNLELGEDGSFIYTPREGKQGRDSFGYQVLNGKGQIIRQAIVSVRIEKQRTGLIYEDMRGRAEGCAAVMLGEKGLFVGEKVVDHYCFSPQKPVTRGEFLAICMSLSGKPVLRAVQSTGYSDDVTIPVWMKSYVSSASIQGVGAWNGGSLDPSAAITQQEASEIAEQTLGLVQNEWGQSDNVLDRATMAMMLFGFLNR